MYGGGLDYVTPGDSLYENNSFVSHAKYGPSIPVNHDVPDGSSICASFIERTGGAYVTHSPACETIHR